MRTKIYYITRKMKATDADFKIEVETDSILESHVFCFDYSCYL